MSESIRLKQDEQIQELMDLVETLQKESEDKDKVITEKDRIIAEQEEVLAEQTGLIEEQRLKVFGLEREREELQDKLNASEEASMRKHIRRL